LVRKNITKTVGKVSLFGGKIRNKIKLNYQLLVLTSHTKLFPKPISGSGVETEGYEAFFALCNVQVMHKRGCIHCCEEIWLQDKLNV
jgi:hypothetical protein